MNFGQIVIEDSGAQPLSDFYQNPTGTTNLYIYFYQATTEPTVLIGDENADFGSDSDTPINGLPIIKGAWHPLPLPQDESEIYLRKEDGSSTAYIAFVVATRSVG